MSHEEIAVAMTAIQKDVTEIRKFLLGNGSIGLVSKVLIMWRGLMWFGGVAGVAGIGYAISRFL